MGWIENRPVAWVSIGANFGHKNNWRISRAVVLPDYQGIGIMKKILATVAAVYTRKGLCVTSSARHPSLLNVYSRSPYWTISNVYRQGTAKHSTEKKKKSAGPIVTAVYTGPRGVEDLPDVKIVDETVTTRNPADT